MFCSQLILEPPHHDQASTRERDESLFISRSPSEKLTSSIFVAQIWKPPDVAQPDDLSSHRQEELDLAVPLTPLIVLPVV